MSDKYRITTIDGETFKATAAAAKTAGRNADKAGKWCIIEEYDEKTQMYIQKFNNKSNDFENL